MAQQRDEAEPQYPAPGSTIPAEENGGQSGYVVGECGHRVAGSEWTAGYRTCERCSAASLANGEPERCVCGHAEKIHRAGKVSVVSSVICVAANCDCVGYRPAAPDPEVNGGRM